MPGLFCQALRAVASSPANQHEQRTKDLIQRLHLVRAL